MEEEAKGPAAVVRSETDATFSGPRTDRGHEMFPVSGVELRLYPHFIRALGMVKLAAARANFEYGRLSPEVLRGIESACQDLIEGGLRDEFRIDVLQGAAGTAMNDLANTVIADRALERMGRGRGEYAYCDPDEHVGRSQAPSAACTLALHVGLALGHVELTAEVKRLAAALRAKGQELTPPGDGGRPPEPDGSGPTDGQELEAFAKTLAGEVRALGGVWRELRNVRLVAPLRETGVDVPAGFAARWEQQLTRITGFPVRLTEGRDDAILHNQAFVLYSSCLKNLAVRLSRISSDLRLLCAPPRGPRERERASRTASPTWTGMDLIVAEVVNMVGFRVIGSDLTVTLAAEASPRESRMFEPVIAASLLDAQTNCGRAAWALRVRCVEALTVDRGAADPAQRDRAGELAAEVMEAGRGIAELLQEKKVLSEHPAASTRDPRGTAAWKRPSRRNARE